MSTNSVACVVAKSMRAAINGRPRASPAEAAAWRAAAAGTRRRKRSIRPPAQTRPGRRAGRCPPAAVTRARGTGRPSGAWSALPRVRPGPAAEPPSRSARPPGRASAARRTGSGRPSPGRPGRRRRDRRTIDLPGGRALAPVPGYSLGGLDDAAGELPERRQRSHARLVVASDYVVEAEAQHGVEHERHQHVARHRQADPAVRLEAVELLLDDLPVAGEELRKIGPEALRPRRLDEEVESRQLHIAELAERVPQRLDADLQHLEEVGELVQCPAQLLDRLRGQIAPGLDQQLGLGGEPVLEVADRDPSLGRDAPHAGARVTVLEERVGRRVDDLVAGACGGGRPGHTYVPVYRRPICKWGDR